MCTLCGTSSDTTNLNSLQQGRGISCFCSGQMSHRDPQYYDTAIHSKEVCEKLGRYRGFHRDVGSTAKPTREEWLAAAERGCNATGVLQLTCTLCGTSSSITSLLRDVFSALAFFLAWSDFVVLQNSNATQRCLWM